MNMIDHMSTYTRDWSASHRFYRAAMDVLGHEIQAEMTASWDPDFPERRLCAWGPDSPVFWLIETKEVVTPRHFAFSAASRQDVDAFHIAALAAGGEDHGAPGPRPVYHSDYYGAFVLDPDGNNVEAVCHVPN